MKYSKWLSREQLQKIYRFLGRKAIGLSALSVLSGAGLFLFEFAFAYAMQIFLLVIGLANTETLRVPEFASRLNLESVLMIIIGLVIGRAALQWVQTYVQYAAFARFERQQQWRIANWVYDQHSVNHGEILTLFSEKSRSGATSILFLQTCIFSLSTTLLMILALLYLLPFPTLIALMILSLLYFPLRKLNRSIDVDGALYTQIIKGYIARLMLGLRNLLLLKIYAMEKSEREFQKREQNHATDLQLRYYRLVGISAGIPPVLGIGVICGLVLVIRQNGVVQPGILVSYFYLFFRMLQAAAQTTMAFSQFAFHLPNLVETARWWSQFSFDGIHGAKADEEEHDLPDFGSSGPLGFRVKDLVFGYGGDHAPIFSNYQLEIPPGEAFGIIGESGAGKSTLISLLLGQIQPQKGEVIVIGDKERTWPLARAKRKLLDGVGYVGPEPFLFDGTLLENLCYGLKSPPNPISVEKCLMSAGCDFVFKLPQGINHRVTDQGQGLSAGQKQRLSLARALLRNPRVLVLDEATSNLDSQTELKLIETLRPLRGQITMIIVTHRESFLQLTDRVIRMTPP